MLAFKTAFLAAQKEHNRTCQLFKKNGINSTMFANSALQTQVLILKRKLCELHLGQKDVLVFFF